MTGYRNSFGLEFFQREKFLKFSIDAYFQMINTITRMNIRYTGK